MAKSTFGERVRDMGIFIDNHDQPRFLTQASGNINLLQNGLALLQTWIGIPYLYYGTE